MLLDASGSMVRQLESLFEGSSVAGLSDRQLLDRFIARRDAVGEAAFAGLVFRHGRLVLGVCNELLADHHEAEDAFQAVFLILAQKAHAIRDPDVLGNWLYGVTLRTCRQARLCIARRRKHEEAAQMSNSGSIAAAPSPPSNRSWPASRPSCCTNRSSACPAFSGCRSCSATSRA